MFKKAKQKIVFSILTILATVLVGTLGMVYLTSYWSTTAQNYQVLEQQMERLTAVPNDGQLQVDVEAVQSDDEQIQSNDGTIQSDDESVQPDDEQIQSDDGRIQPDDGKLWMNGGKRKERIQRNLEVGTFYGIKLFSDGNAEVLENGADGLYTDEELIEYAREVTEESQGRLHDLLYLVEEQNGITYVCFMDNTVFTDSFGQLFIFTLLFGVIAMIAITFISVYIANRIVSPMEESYRKEKQFTADAGHELKTPVAAVATNLELLRREIGDNPWLENISYENERMRDLITQLLELARNENKEPERQTTDLSRLVNGEILPHEAAAFEKNILIETDIAPAISAHVNAKSIEQLITILLDNAISHAQWTDGEFGTITVHLSEHKGNAILVVSNPGEEIPESERPRLFERFYRTDSSHEFTGHYGLGLAIAKSITDANHASIHVDCANGNVSFRVVFPAHA